MVKKNGSEVIHPYNDERIIAGQGTCAKELIEDCPDLDIIVSPVSGGGLIGGTLIMTNEIEEKIRKNFTKCWQYFFDYQIPMITRWKAIFGDIETWTIWGNCVYNQNLVMSKLVKANHELLKNNDTWIKRLNDYGNQGLNAMTISELTGIPRPTVIRKLKIWRHRSY